MQPNSVSMEPSLGLIFEHRASEFPLLGLILNAEAFVDAFRLLPADTRNGKQFLYRSIYEAMG